MTTQECTTNPIDLRNTPHLYPVSSPSKPLHVNEDNEDYGESSGSKKIHNKTALKKLRIDTDNLKHYIEQQLDNHKGRLSLRIVRLFDDLTIDLKQHKEITLFELLIELTLYADKEPAQDMVALLAVLNNDALFELEEFDIVNAATYLRDTMKKDMIRWHLQDYRDEQEAKKKKNDRMEVGGRATQDAKAEKGKK